MRILEYTGLDTHKVAKAYRKVAQAIASRDFRAAQVKKLGQAGQGRFYRARLDDSNRLLFTLVRHGGEVCALMLEVILNHDYDKSRFLRGAVIDEDKIPDIDWTEAETESRQLASMRYLHPEHASVHLLDKPISFDDVQEAIYRQPAPLIVVGSAGSGKTALTLEKLKHAEGEVLYVTHSAFLAQSARDLYYANGFEQPGQEAIFLSYREFIESIEVPPGREALWRDFAAWFTRMRQAFKDIEAHQAFEEVRGVLAASAQGLLSREAYRALGVRQSIFPPERRDALYDLFEKYRAWLAESRLFDLNLVARDWLARARPRYDFVVIDEVQDLTPVQLALVLRTLKKPGQFLLCGDSNQIVHPNFFSWAQVKSLFWQDAALAERQGLSVLAANFRNGHEATRVANQLLKIKQRRFGSIDRESNFLVQAVGGETGAVRLLADKDSDKKALNQQIRQSTQFAVLVMRDEDKAQARQHFSTPLLFSIHEAKGLEYENIVLYRFVSDHRAEFGEIVEGVRAEDLQSDSLEYRRARDKSDKSLEVYKFFVNALYVALTRAIRNLYLIESDLRHPLFDLLEVRDSGQVRLDVKQSSLEDWQKEARKLELQGKQEQADAIRKDILRQATPPWPVFDQTHTEDLMRKVLIEQVPGNKHRQQLLEIAACHNLPELANGLNVLSKFPAAQRVIGAAERNQPQARFHPPRNVFERPSDFSEQFGNLARKSLSAYTSRHIKEVLRQCDVYGLEHRLPMNLTPLMAAAMVGNVALVEALIERGADREATDHFGHNALHWAMLEAFRDSDFARGPFATLYDLLAPASIDINTGQRLVRIDKHLTEYFLLQTLWVLLRLGFTSGHMGFYEHCAFRTDMVLDVWEDLPTSVLRAERNKRSHLSNVLSRNEVERDYAYNRMLFKRVAHGHYQFNPALSVRRKVNGEERWVPVFEALNLRLLGQFILYQHNKDFMLPERSREYVDRYLEWAQLAPMETPIIRSRVRP
ncbi:UvrD-helicase domain-containing protein [Malikia sp.]|uniref:UvrD-helicase domain-containing protein n=1 Tax=Malikia sp. TaxID=2070706 RepID=UPI0026287466|nr:UvrD-helicase domain-containing protein [Malikia sp.]MDD2728116.1 UvrD-helicase domain-containing protein [Malikia sp.]